MECSKVRELLSDYIEDELSLSDMQSVREHIATCDACAGDCRELAQTLHMIHSLPKPAPVGDLWLEFAAGFGAPQEVCNLSQLSKRIALGWKMFLSVSRFSFDRIFAGG